MDHDISGAFGNHKYRQIVAEGVFINHLPYSRKTLLNLLTDDGIFIHMSNGQEMYRMTKHELQSCSFYEFVKAQYSLLSQHKPVQIEEYNGCVSVWIGTCPMVLGAKEA